jgi:hypothetical protein
MKIRVIILKHHAYPFFRFKGTKDRLIAPEDIEEMYNRMRLNAKRKVFGDLYK